MSNQAEEQNKRRAFEIVRILLLVGVVLFGGIAWFLGRVQFAGGMAPNVFQGIESYVWYGFILTFVGVFGAAVALRSRWQAADDFKAERQINIAGWALAELTAILGGVYLMLVGDPTFFGAGLGLMIFASFVLLPISTPD